MLTHPKRRMYTLTHMHTYNTPDACPEQHTPKSIPVARQSWDTAVWEGAEEMREAGRGGGESKQEIKEGGRQNRREEKRGMALRQRGPTNQQGLCSITE